jgi:hypothetical protein
MGSSCGSACHDASSRGLAHRAGDPEELLINVACAFSSLRCKHETRRGSSRMSIWVARLSGGRGRIRNGCGSFAVSW